MPELPEVEAYRRLAERAALGREVLGVEAPDPRYLKHDTGTDAVRAALVGRRFTAARRIGKLLLLDSDGGPTLGLRFGMAGRLVVDGVAGVDALLYSSDAEMEAWDRFTLHLARASATVVGGVVAVPGRLTMRDPRRLGGVELDPDESRLGPDALVVGPAGLRRALGTSAAPLKARLMDQSRIAGVGNLIADEVLWRAGLDPTRRAGGLSEPEVRRLARTLRSTVEQLIVRGGSHTGELMASRVRDGVCPRDGTPLLRRTVGGRTTWSCPVHQR